MSNALEKSKAMTTINGLEESCSDPAGFFLHMVSLDHCYTFFPNCNIGHCTPTVGECDINSDSGRSVVDSTVVATADRRLLIALGVQL